MFTFQSRYRVTERWCKSCWYLLSIYDGSNCGSTDAKHDFAFAFWCCKMYDVWRMTYDVCAIAVCRALYCSYCACMITENIILWTKLLVVVTGLVENARIKYLSRWFSTITSVMLWCTPSITGTFELTSPLNFHLVW
jgi:hypothetical protein